jgi:hypothetical protein
MGRVRRREDQHDLGDIRVRRERTQGPEHDGNAADRVKLFGSLAAESNAASRGYND